MTDLEGELQYLVKQCSTKKGNDLWSNRVRSWIDRVVDADGRLNQKALDNFRRLQVFVNEMPRKELFPIGWTNGFDRGSWKYMKERLQVLKEEGDADLLAKFPISRIGNPIVAHHEGYRFNKRWINNIRYLGLAKRYLGAYLEEDGAALVDIGGAYGAFLYLLRNEFPTVKLAIVEFPEQLILTRYFLQKNWPDAKINRLQEVYDVGLIDCNFLDKFDFVLIPIECYDKIKAGTFGTVTNFFSLGEMSEAWFERYMKGEALEGATYFMTINRIQSFPTYDTSLTLIDYGLEQYKSLHFQVSEHEKYYYARKNRIFMAKEYYTSPFFEFVGKKLP